MQSVEKYMAHQSVSSESQPETPINAIMEISIKKNAIFSSLIEWQFVLWIVCVEGD